MFQTKEKSVMFEPKYASHNRTMFRQEACEKHL